MYRSPYLDLLADTFHWKRWEALIRERGITIDRPADSAHPSYASIIYPMDYGFVNETLASDGKEIDLFRGSSDRGLVGTIVTIDHRQEKREFKLLWGCTAREVYLANGFINFDRTLLEGMLVLRYGMDELREKEAGSG